ncbi:MAG: hypothetical protein CL610_28675 [Anaerolineaceae bacterium]|nr:hypothetical protein [Anaerolineaceae bacterium]
MRKRWPQWRSFHALIRALQGITASVMLLLAVDWAIGDGTHRAWLAVLGIVLTLLQIIDQSDSD